MSEAPADLRFLRQAALRWYDRHGRRLPWRTNPDPYRVWISEIMLQQTTVAAVVPYFERFTTAFPDIASLAAAETSHVLRHWEGLGYYSRARNLHKAAGVIMQQFGGRIPRNPAELQSLPGIGRYTAGAICSFAFNLPAPILEANTERLYARLTGLQDDVRSASGRAHLWSFAESLTSRHRSGDLNQALMDLGARICRPAEPLCTDCPLKRECAAFRTGRQNDLPVKGGRTAITPLAEIGLVLRSRGRLLVRQRSAGERWAGMWDFPRWEIPESVAVSLRSEVPALKSASRTSSSPDAPARRGQRNLFVPERGNVPRSILNQARDLTNLEPETLTDSIRFSYSVTRYRIELFCLVFEVNSLQGRSAEFRPFTRSELTALPMPGTGRRIMNWLPS